MLMVLHDMAIEVWELAKLHCQSRLALSHHP